MFSNFSNFPVEKPQPHGYMVFKRDSRTLKVPIEDYLDGKKNDSIKRLITPFFVSNLEESINYLSEQRISPFFEDIEAMREYLNGVKANEGHIYILEIGYKKEEFCRLVLLNKFNQAVISAIDYVSWILAKRSNKEPEKISNPEFEIFSVNELVKNNQEIFSFPLQNTEPSKTTDFHLEANKIEEKEESSTTQSESSSSEQEPILTSSSPVSKSFKGRSSSSKKISLTPFWKPSKLTLPSTTIDQYKNSILTTNDLNFFQSQFLSLLEKPEIISEVFPAKFCATIAQENPDLFLKLAYFTIYSTIYDLTCEKILEIKRFSSSSCLSDLLFEIHYLLEKNKNKNIINNLTLLQSNTLDSCKEFLLSNFYMLKLLHLHISYLSSPLYFDEKIIKKCLELTRLTIDLAKVGKEWKYLPYYDENFHHLLPDDSQRQSLNSYEQSLSQNSSPKSSLEFLNNFMENWEMIFELDNWLGKISQLILKRKKIVMDIWEKSHLPIFQNPSLSEIKNKDLHSYYKSCSSFSYKGSPFIHTLTTQTFKDSHQQELQSILIECTDKVSLKKRIPKTLGSPQTTITTKTRKGKGKHSIKDITIREVKNDKEKASSLSL